MKISFDNKGGFDNVTKWLNRTSNARPSRSIESIQRDGIDALKMNTPTDTGETSQGWKSDAKITTKGVEISWTNDAHPESEVNVAKLIELGHGTRTGGYVEPQPFIKQAMDPVFKDAGDKVVKEMIK